MRKLKPWTRNNFTAGMHSEPSQLGKSEDVPAEDMSNLRYTPEGSLITRWGQEVVYEDGAVISGIAAVQVSDTNYVLWLSGTTLVMNEIGGVRTDLVTDADFDGRICAVSANNEMVVVVTEGDDTGYWVDLANAAAYPLTIESPAIGVGVTYTPTAGGSMDANSYYYYRMVFGRMPANATEWTSGWSALAGVANGWLNPGNGYWYYTYVSGTTGAAEPVWPTTQGATVADGTAGWVCMGEDEPDSTMMLGSISPPATTEVHLSGGEQSVTIDFPATTDGQVLMAQIFRSEGYPSPLTDEAIEQLTYYYANNVLYYAPGQQNVLNSDSDVDIRVRHTFEVIHGSSFGAMPSGTKCLASYNNRLWAAGYGSGVRYTDVESGNPRFWSWPEDNEIWSPYGSVDVCVGLEDFLFMGGSEIHGRLIGTTERDFDVDWSGFHRGPIDSYAWCRVGGWVAFISTDGVYLYDGQRATSLSAAIERDAAFRGENVGLISGSMVSLPTGELLVNLYNTTLAGFSDTTYVFSMRSKAWRKLLCIEPVQFTSYEIAGTVVVLYPYRTTAFIRQYRNDSYAVANPTVDDTDNSGTTDAIDWYWLSQELDWFAPNNNKEFGPLTIQTPDEETMTVQVWLDGTSIISQAFTVAADSAFMYELPLWAYGRKIQFKLSGSGVVQIDSVQMEASR